MSFAVHLIEQRAALGDRHVGAVLFQVAVERDRHVPVIELLHERHRLLLPGLVGPRRGYAQQQEPQENDRHPLHALFICDTNVNLDPTAEQVAEMTMLAAEEVRRFGLSPKVALLSHSNFGSHGDASARKMSRARELLEQLAPELDVEGEMHGDAALSESMRLETFPASRYKGVANLLIMPNLDAANIAYNLLKMTGGEGVTIGSILLGANKSVHILTTTATVRRIVNMSALAVAGVRFAVQRSEESYWSWRCVRFGRRTTWHREYSSQDC